MVRHWISANGIGHPVIQNPLKIFGLFVDAAENIRDVRRAE
jgi:hypothetical protein